MSRLILESARVTQLDSADGPSLIELYGSDGSIGIGETGASPFALDAAARLCASLIGLEALHTTTIRQCLEAASNAFQIPIHVTGGVQCAVWDLVGRHLRAPLHVLLGAGRPQSVLAPGLVRMDDERQSVTALVARTAALVRKFNYEALLVVISRQEVPRGTLALRELRRELGAELRIRVECCGEDDVANASVLLATIEDLDIEYVAGAAQKLADLETLRRKCNTPLASAVLPGDGLASWVRAGAGEVIIGDAVGWGGVSAFRAHLSVCRAFSVDLAVTAGYTLGPAIATSVQLVAAHSGATKGFHAVPQGIETDCVVVPAPIVRNGRMAVLEGPGIGCTLDAARLQSRTHLQKVIASPAGTPL